MLFLIEYDRSAGKICRITSFADSERLLADETRLNRELELNERGVDREIVLLQAESEDAIRKTHRRYFEDLTELANALPLLPHSR